MRQVRCYLTRDLGSRVTAPSSPGLAQPWRRQEVAGARCCTVLFSRRLFLAPAAANKKHRGSILFLTSGFYCSRKFLYQDNLMKKVGDIHPSRASACSFSICKLYRFSCLQQTEHTYSLLSPYGSTKMRCTVHPDVSFKNSHSCTEKATCRVGVN